MHRKFSAMPRNWKADLEARIASGDVRAVDSLRRPVLDLNTAAQAAAAAGTAAVRAVMKTEAAMRADWGVPRPGRAAPGITARATIARVPGFQNRTEAAYAALLEQRRRAGEIADYLFEELRLKVGVDSWYTPDFSVTLPCGGIYLVEVKAFRLNADGTIYKVVNEDAREKVCACLLRHPFAIRYAFGRQIAKRDGGGYEFREEWAGGIEPV
jgi:hypothetical protein